MNLAVVVGLCLVATVVAVLLWRLYMAYSLWGCLSAIFSFLAVDKALFLLSQPHLDYILNGWVVLAAAGLPALVEAVRAATRRRGRLVTEP